MTGGTVTDCYNTGTITVNDASVSTSYEVCIGGIVGEMTDTTIRNCYNTGTISVTTSDEYSFYVGGVAGSIVLATTSIIENCYNIGVVNVTGEGSGFRYVGGVAGHLEIQGTVGLTVTGSYFLQVEDGINDGLMAIGNGSEPQEGVTPVTDASKIPINGESGLPVDDWMMNEILGWPILRSNIQYAPVQSLALSQTSARLPNVGDTEVLTVTAYPDNLAALTAKWATSDPEVATVAEDGTVTAVADGTATITVTVDGQTAACTVTVGIPYVPPATYAIAVESSGNGTVRASASRAAAGSRVALTVSPNEGYVLDSLTVTDGSGAALTLTETATGYTFTMPASAVTVTAIFEEINHADTCPSGHFNDVDLNSWYHDALDYVIENGLMIGTSDTTFEPEATMNRAMLAQILYNMEGQPEVTGESAFTDVTAGDWYHDAVVWAAENGIVLGVGDTEFAPLDAISREQFAVMLYRYADFKGLDTSASGDLSAFTDAESISDWATEAVTWAVGAEVLRGYGDGILNPIGGSMRAEAAQMLLNFSEIQ